MTKNTSYKAYVVVEDAAGNTSDVLEVGAFSTANNDFAISSMGTASAGGVGQARTITCTGTFTGSEFLVVQIKDGEKVSVNCIQIPAGTNSSVQISYQSDESQVSAWLTSGLPDFTNPLNLGVTIYVPETKA